MINPTLRLTAQLNRATQVGFFMGFGGYRLSDYPQIGVVGAAATATPETGTVGGSGRSPMFRYKWSWTATSRLLLDASYGSYHQDWNGREVPGNNRDLIRVTEQCAGGLCQQRWRRPRVSSTARKLERRLHGAEPVAGAATYVTGAHNMKVGYQGVYHWNQVYTHTNNYNLEYRFNNGVPNQLTQTLRPYQTDSRVRYNAFYAQDQWTRGKLTFQGALRYDHAWSYFPAQEIRRDRLPPGRRWSSLSPRASSAINDIDPRIGVA